MKKFLLVMLLLAVALTAMANGRKDAGTEDVIDLTVTMSPKFEIGVTQQLDNPDNVISPYLAERFGLRVSEILKVPGDMTYPQALVMWKAAGMVPDLMRCGAEDFGAMVASGAFAPVDAFLENMPNYERFLPREHWSREVGEDGKIYAFYGMDGHTWPQGEPASDDVVTMGINQRAMWIREDVLRAVGYDFTPMEEIKATTVDLGIRPSPEQLAINPPVDTPEAFLKLLRRIKAADLKATDGSEMIPFSMVSWETWHLGVMFDWGYWRINEEGDVDGYLGLPGTEEYMRWLWTAYREGLIDPDYLVHKSVQLQEKVAIGKVAMGEYVPDAKGTFAQLSANVPGSTRRFIAFPKSNPEYGFYDTYNPHPYHRTLVNKNLSDDAMTRIASFVDWCYTDEGASILSWGPESAGLYTEQDGRRVFVDPAVEEAVKAGAIDGVGPYKWGIYDPVIDMLAEPLAHALGPGRLHRTVLHEYNEARDFMALASSVVGSEPRSLGVSTRLQAANSDQSEVVQGVADWYWGIFPQSYLPQLLQSETEDQFEERFALMIDAFRRETNYEDAKANMEAYFEKFPPLFD